MEFVLDVSRYGPLGGPRAACRPPPAASPGFKFELRTPSAALGDFPKDCLVQLHVCQQPLQPRVLLLELLESLRFGPSANRRTSSSNGSGSAPSRRSSFTASATVLPLPSSTSTSRSFRMMTSACSAFPRGISCPPLAAAAQDSRSRSGLVEGGQVIGTEINSVTQQSGCHDCKVS